MAAAVGAVTPLPNHNGAARNDGGGGGAASKFELADATLGSMRAARASLGTLPLAQQQSLRDECAALMRELDKLRVPPATR